MLEPAWKKNDVKAKRLIVALSIVVFTAVVILGRVKLDVRLGFNEHIFAGINAVINSAVSLLLLSALLSVKMKNYLLHKRLMITAIILSSLFLISYICHHLFSGETSYGGTGTIRYVYYFILGTHIILAGVILPFILFTAYRAMIGDWIKHKRLARITWPIWFYVAVTGVIVYLMISPYYN